MKVSVDIMVNVFSFRYIQPDRLFDKMAVAFCYISYHDIYDWSKSQDDVSPLFPTDSLPVKIMDYTRYLCKNNLKK